MNPGLPHCRQALYWLSHQGRALQIWDPWVKSWIFFQWYDLGKVIELSWSPVFWSLKWDWLLPLLLPPIVLEFGVGGGDQTCQTLCISFRTKSLLTMIIFWHKHKLQIFCWWFKHHSCYLHWVLTMHKALWKTQRWILSVYQIWNNLTLEFTLKTRNGHLQHANHCISYGTNRGK